MTILSLYFYLKIVSFDNVDKILKSHYLNNYVIIYFQQLNDELNNELLCSAWLFIETATDNRLELHFKEYFFL